MEHEEFKVSSGKGAQQNAAVIGVRHLLLFFKSGHHYSAQLRHIAELFETTAAHLHDDIPEELSIAALHKLLEARDLAVLAGAHYFGHSAHGLTVATHPAGDDHPEVRAAFPAGSAVSREIQAPTPESDLAIASVFGRPAMNQGLPPVPRSGAGTGSGNTSTSPARDNSGSAVPPAGPAATTGGEDTAGNAAGASAPAGN